MLLCGAYYRRLSLRAGMAGAGLLAAQGFLVFGAAHSFAVYCLAAALVGIGYGFGTMIPVSVVLERWFIRERTLAVGICSSVTGLSTLGVPSFLTMLARGEGFSAQTTALAITVSGITLMASKFGYGWLSERMSSRGTNWLFGGLLTLGLVLCCVTRGSRLLLYIAMVVYGMGLPLGTVGLTVWAGDLSGPEDYDDTIRRFQAGYAAGGLVFSTLPGLLADRFGGSYVPAYIFFTACAVFAVLSIQWVYRRGSAAQGGEER